MQTKNINFTTNKEDISNEVPTAEAIGSVLGRKSLDTPAIPSDNSPIYQTMPRTSNPSPKENLCLNSISLASAIGELSKGVYHPPPLPPRSGSLKERPGSHTSPSPVANGSLSVIGTPYKPVPPPKPYSGLSNKFQDNEGLPNHRIMNGDPKMLPHILVTDQGQFLTHSTKFPISDDCSKPTGNVLEAYWKPTGNEAQYKCQRGGIDNPGLVMDQDMRLRNSYMKNKEISTNHYAQMTGYDPCSHSGYFGGKVEPPRSHYGTNSLTYGHSHPLMSGLQHPEVLGHWNVSSGNPSSHNAESFLVYHTPEKKQYQHQTAINSRPYNPSHLTHNGTGRTISFAPETTILNHHELVGSSNETPTIMCNGRTVGVYEMNNGCHTSQCNTGLANGHVPNAQQGNVKNGNDDKWGSLKKTPGKTYSQLKSIISSKFNKIEVKAGNADNKNNSEGKLCSQGQSVRKEVAFRNSGPPPLHNGLVDTSGNFQRVVTYGSLKSKVEDQNALKREESSVYIIPDRIPFVMPNTSSMNVQVSQTPSTRQQNEVLAAKRAGSCSHLVPRVVEPSSPQVPAWSIHHRSQENVSRTLPSDLTYPVDQRNKATSTNNLPSVREGKVESDSGRGTGGSCTEFKSHDTSLESGSSNRPHPAGQSSGNESEWVDIPDTETPTKVTYSVTNKGSYDSGARTPPLPPLTPEISPKTAARGKGRKQSHSFSSRGANSKPDLLETTQTSGVEHTPVADNNERLFQRSTSLLPSSVKGWVDKDSKRMNEPSSKNLPNEEFVKVQPENGTKTGPQVRGTWRTCPGTKYGDAEDDITSTDAALDLNSVLDGITEDATTDDDLMSRDDDAYVIRRQLEGLEGMYSEVLKVLGRRNSRLGDSRPGKRRLHGSMSSIPSSIMSARPLREKRGKVIDDRLRKASREPAAKTIHKRFQRLESHVVTLARSVAHLSSEMRTQHLMLQEIESIRNELSALRMATRASMANSFPKGGNAGKRGGNVLWNPLESGHLSFSNPERVKKLTQFFGDEPPLVRLFLRKLGYEKYANVFEREKIGMLELPYLSEERLQKLGIPLGPRLRILEESKGPIKREGNLSVYVV